MAHAQTARADGQIKLVDIEVWKKASTDERRSLGPIKACAAPLVPVKEYEGETERILKLIESTPARDRHGDRVMQEGWQLDNYRKNPVGLWMHDHHEHPINRALHTAVEGGQLISYRQFTSRDENPFGFMTYNLLLKNYLNASSVGFRPLNWDEDKDATDEDRARSMWGPVVFLVQELLESSIVTVPANPEALIEARSVHGIDISPYVEFAERILDGEKGAGLWVPRDIAERLHAVVAESKTTSLPPQAPTEPHPLESKVAKLERELAIARGELISLDAGNAKRVKEAHKKLGPVAGKATDDGIDLTADDQKRIRDAHSKLGKVIAALGKADDKAGDKAAPVETPPTDEPRALRITGPNGEVYHITPRTLGPTQEAPITPIKIPLDVAKELLRQFQRQTTSPAAGEQ